MNLKNKIPPPIIALIIGIIISASSTFISPFNVYGIKVLGMIVLTGSFLIIVLSINKFKSEKTTINPLKPVETVKLVKTGTFALSRNPMYFGLAGILVGIALFLEAWLGFIAVPIFIIYINRYQIAPEEKVLEEKFKDQYLSYRKKVRRWF